MKVLRTFAWTACTALAIAAGPGAQASTSLSSSAYGLGATLDVLHLVNVSAGPFAPTSGMAPGAYSNSASVASVSDSLGLGVLGLNTFHQNLGTGLIVSTATLPYPTDTTAMGKSVIDNLDTGLGSLIGPAILNLGATTITSISTVTDVAGPAATGSSDIEGLTLSGAALHGTMIDGALYAHAAPNTVLLNLDGLEIILNQQFSSGDGVSSAGMVTNAIVVEFTNFALGTGLLSGDVIVGHSEADITGAPLAMGTPEPATWALMLIGVGVIGGAARRRALRTVA